MTTTDRDLAYGITTAAREVEAQIETPTGGHTGTVTVATTIAPNPDGSTIRVAVLQVLTVSDDFPAATVYITVDEKSTAAFAAAFAPPVGLTQVSVPAAADPFAPTEHDPIGVATLGDYVEEYPPLTENGASA